MISAPLRRRRENPYKGTPKKIVDEITRLKRRNFIKKKLHDDG